MDRKHLLSRRMLEFNFLPSVTLHPSRYANFAPGDPAMLKAALSTWPRTWHRNWSREILKRMQVGVVSDADPAAFVVCLLPTEMLKRLALRLGAVLHGTSLRHTIQGSRVRALRAALGEDLLQFARLHAHKYAVFDDEKSGMSIDAAEWERDGYGVILRALDDGQPELLRRAELKLPIEVHNTHCGLPQVHALDLCVRVLKDSEPAWYSSFPATH